CPNIDLPVVGHTCKKAQCFGDLSHLHVAVPICCAARTPHEVCKRAPDHHSGPALSESSAPHERTINKQRSCAANHAQPEGDLKRTNRKQSVDDRRPLFEEPSRSRADL